MPALRENLARKSYDQKVIRAFIVDGRLKAIPAQRKKRFVILRYLVRLFEHGRVYSEVEVNEIIGRMHEDFATLRREPVRRGCWCDIEASMHVPTSQLKK